MFVPPGTDPPLNLPTARPAEPIDTPSLGHVPALATVVFAARPASLPELRARLLGAGLPSEALAPLDAVGLPLEDIEELAGGLVVLPDTLIPRAVVVLTLSDRTDVSRFRTRSKAILAGPANTYQISVRGVPVFSREQSAQTLVLATDQNDLTSVATPGGRHLRSDVQATVARVPDSSRAWLATAVQDWSRVPAVALGQKFLKADGPDRLAGVSALCVSVPAEGEPVIERRLGQDWK